MNTPHLHVHTRYTRQLAMGSSEVLVDMLPKGSFLAITDTNTMAGIYEHQRACVKAGAEPIFGMEMSVGGSHSIVALAENETGLENLYALGGMTMGERSYRALRKHGEGLIALTGHLGGAVPTAVLRKDVSALNFHLSELLGVFGANNLYLEKVDWGLREQARINKALDEVSQRTGLRTVWANDVHYPKMEDALWHSFIVCDGLGKASSLDEMLSHRVTGAWLRELPPDPVAVEIAERCIRRLPHRDPMLPKFCEDDDGMLRAKAREGLAARLKGSIHGEYSDRLEYELDVIIRMGYAGYFLIVSDFITWAKEHGIPVGPGRGSGAGSLVAWAIRITEVDSVRHKLYFERFLNPDRVTMPDFDIDFGQDRRGEVIEYVRGRYGAANVAQIATYNGYKLKKAVDSAGRILGIYPDERIQVSKRYLSMKNEKREDFTAKELVESGNLAQLFQFQPQYKIVMQAAIRMEEGLREQGRHPAGVIILDRPAHKVLPMVPGGTTALTFKDAETAGAVKFDFLGLAELDVLDYANAAVDYAVDLDNLPEDDPKTFEMLRAGYHVGVFQVSGDAFSEFFTRLQPYCQDHITVAVALFRPGPMDILPRGAHEMYVDRLHGVEAVSYLHDDMALVLEETYGIIVFQEQILALVRQLAGLTMAQADLLRRAIGKKDKAKLDAERAKFIAGAAQNGYDEDTMQKVWVQIEQFARYGFNRAHAAAYAWLTYQTAYMKAHYPAEFLGAQCRVRGAKKMAEIDPMLIEAVKMGCTLERPSINHSPVHFCGSNGVIKWGLSALAGVGEEVAERIVSMRPYRTLKDFFVQSGVDKSVFATLLHAGALDELIGVTNQQQARDMYPVLEAMFPDMARKREKEDSRGTVFMFEVDPAFDPKEAAKRLKLARRGIYKTWLDVRAATGTWVKGHPVIDYFGGATILAPPYVAVADMERYENSTITVLASVIEKWSYERLDRGEFNTCANLIVEDHTGRRKLGWYKRVDFTMVGDGLVSLRVKVYRTKRGSLTYLVEDVREVHIAEDNL